MSFVPATNEQRLEMLRACSAASIGELFADIPKTLAPPAPHSGFFGTEGASEFEALTICERLASENNARIVSFLGGGFYDHFIPAAVDAVASRSEFYTAYTPYQPELSQGTLQAIYEYQSQICRLTGMEISNASLYDGGTAIFEACKMAMSSTSRRKVIVDCGVNPTYRKMLKTHTAAISVDIAEVPLWQDGGLDRQRLSGVIDDGVAAVVLQNPNFFGVIDDHSDIVDKCKSVGAIAIQSVYPLALPLIKSPAEQGFDIAVGEGQPLGLPLSFGGPYLGFIGAKKQLARKMPGRIVARTADAEGRDGFVLSLQAREQHIRREKATSNICSNEALCALRAHAYLSLLGKNGLIDVANLCRNKAAYLRECVKKSIPSIKITDRPIFNEFTMALPISADDCVKAMAERGFAAGIPVGRYYGGDSDNVLLAAVTEKRTKAEIDCYVGNLREAVGVKR
ncbi:MAG: aminomethyl-transferring glycine dehydrogenase subunit GcvPA [Chitinispirillales bacterium]|jgi:glycine dehydrogenase subunit 1|nr:aminomethyl-transferring glycine dehydrogenase subunit GcvPA [Chitinispirillales bacterium]